MAKVHLDRLKKKYTGVKVSGTVYSDLIKQIIEVNTGNVQRKIATVSKDKFNAFAKRYRTRETRLVVPSDLSEILPKRAIHVRKAAETGEMISDTLRDALTKNLRDRLNTFSDKTGLQSFVTRRGKFAGRINKDLLRGFEKDIEKVFFNYTKKDKKLAMPKNIHTIAVTETRSSINEIKAAYTDKFVEKNPDLILQKKWVQNRSLAKKPRTGHSIVNEAIVDYDQKFKVPLYKIVKGKEIKIGVTLMKYPHDPSAPASQVIGCNCDFDIIVSKKSKRVAA